MKDLKTPSSRVNKNIRWLTARRDALLKRLGKLGPCMGGSLVLIERTCGNKAHCHCAKGPKHVSLYLTFAEKGKTRTLYVPVDLESEVRRWSQNHRDLKSLMGEVSDLSRAIIRRFVQERSRRHDRTD